MLVQPVNCELWIVNWKAGPLYGQYKYAVQRQM